MLSNYAPQNLWHEIAIKVMRLKWLVRRNKDFYQAEFSRQIFNSSNDQSKTISSKALFPRNHSNDFDLFDIRC